uniref:DH domain-containing protein n=1 Tax=Taenia asiatica TaxID=60517 RepID=A0A158R9K8_TAEAS
LEQSNQQLWQRLSGLSSNPNEQKLAENDTHSRFELPDLVRQHITDARKQSASPQASGQMSCLYSVDPGEKTQIQMKVPCVRVTCNSHLSGGPFVTKISKLEHTRPTTYQFSPTFLEPVKTDESVGTNNCPRGISKYTQMREHVDGVYPLNTSPTPVEKESVALMPLVEGPGSISEGENDELTSVMPRPRMQNLMMQMMQESEASEAAGGNSQSQHQQWTSAPFRVHSDTDPFANYPGMGKFPPKYVKRKLWTMETVGTSSSASSSSSMGNPCIPYNNGGSKTASGMRGTRNSVPAPCNVPASNATANPQTLAVRMEVGQARSMILMVLEELVNTESSYLHILSQFLILRDEIFAPNWRIDRQKFIRLFPAAVDDLCNLHRESFDAMKLAFDRTAEEMRHLEDTWSDESLLPHQAHHRYSQYYSRRYRRPRGKLGILSGGDDEARDGVGCSCTTPFNVLLEMIEGKRPLACYSHSPSSPSTSTAAATLYYRSAPLWSTAPFFKLYARYLSEFSGAIQMLNKMRAGPTSLRKHLKQLQSHPACEFNDITTYLLAPVQRLPRYLLLVRKMIQYTEKIERLRNIPPTKRPRPRVGLRRSATPAQSVTTKPGFPRLESLKKAEEALHGMLLELDEMIGGDVMDLKAEARDTTSVGGEEEYDFGTGGGSGGSSGFIKANSVYSNNCSDSVDVNSTNTTFDIASTGDGADVKRRRAQSVAETTRRKMRSSSISFGGCGGSGGGGGGFWSRLKRLRLTFTSSQQKKTAANATVDRAEVRDSGNRCSKEAEFASQNDQQFGEKQHYKHVNMCSRFVKVNCLILRVEVETWRRASSARPHNRTALGKSMTPCNPQRSTQKTKQHSDKFDERKENQKDLPTRKPPQASRATGISKPMLLNFLNGEDRSSVPPVKSGRRSVKHTNKFDHRSSMGNTPIGAATSTAKPVITKSDSDSGVHTQTEEERRRRRHQPSHQAPLHFEQPVFSTGRSRWIGRPGHTPFATTTTTTRQSRRKWQQQQKVPLHQSQIQVLRSSACGGGGQAEDEDEEASRSASPTLSTSSITSSALTASAAESASALVPTVSTSYSLSNVDPHLQPSRPVVGVISEAMNKTRAPTPPPSPPSATLEAVVQEKNRTKVEVQMNQEELASSDGIEVEDDDGTVVADLSAIPNALDDARAVEIELCGHNTQRSRSGHGYTTFDADTPIGATIASVPANSPLESLIDPDADRTVENPSLCAFEMVPLVGRLCLEDLEE